MAREYNVIQLQYLRYALYTYPSVINQKKGVVNQSVPEKPVTYNL